MIQTGLEIIKGLGKSQMAASSDNTILVQHLQQVPQMAVYLITKSQKAPDMQQAHRIDLREKISQAFNLSDLRQLCFDLKISYEDISGGESKQDKVIALIEYAERNGRLSSLISYCQTKREHLIWPTLPLQDNPKINAIQKPDLAVVINLASRFRETTPGDVAAYLDSKTTLAANFCLFQNPNSEKEIELDGQWDLLIRTFHRSLNQARQLAGAEHIHFFLSGPGPLLFAMGSVWGTVEGAKLYHRQANTYHLVINISRNLHN
jgi:hypothetical protein